MTVRRRLRDERGQGLISALILLAGVLLPLLFLFPRLLPRTIQVLCDDYLLKRNHNEVVLFSHSYSCSRAKGYLLV